MGRQVFREVNLQQHLQQQPNMPDKILWTHLVVVENLVWHIRLLLEIVLVLKQLEKLLPKEL